MAKQPKNQRHQQIVQHIAHFQHAQGYAPTARELADAVGMTSLGHLAYYLRQLEGDGLLTHAPGRSRTLRLTPRALALLEGNDGSVRGIPVLGTIAAGTPLILGEVQEVLPRIDPAGFPPNSYALHVRGDSMIDAHILDGDYVILDPLETPSQGMVVVAMHISEGSTGAATLKAFFREHDQVRLQPANPAYSPICIPAHEWEREWAIQGQVVGVVRWQLRSGNTPAHS